MMFYYYWQIIIVMAAMLITFPVLKFLITITVMLKYNLHHPLGFFIMLMLRQPVLEILAWLTLPLSLSLSLSC